MALRYIHDPETRLTDSRLLYGANVQANGIRQHYLRYGGEGAPLLVVPGITSPAATWGFVAERLAQHYDTYVLDVRGRGISESGAILDYGLDACAADLVAVADTLGFASLAILGHSMGARIALRASRTLGTRITKLVLVDPPVSGPGRRPYPIPLEFMLKGLHTAQKGAGVEEMRPFMSKWNDREIRIRAEWLPTCDQRAIETAFRGFHEDDIHADFAQVKAETLLMVAGLGGVVQPEDVDEIKDLLPSTQVERVANAGHMIPYEDYEGFFRALVPFLGHSL
jgi:N-formylmaleamate deformylase